MGFIGGNGSKPSATEKSRKTLAVSVKKSQEERTWTDAI